MRTALWRDGPQDVGQIFAAEALRRDEVVQLGVNLGAALARPNDRVTHGLGQQHRSTQIDLGRLGAIFVVDCLGSALHYRDLVDGCRAFVLGRIRGRWSLGKGWRSESKRKSYDP